MKNNSKMLVIAAFAALTSMFSAGAASAAQIDSIYTDIDLNECMVINADDMGASFACPGYKGYPLWIAEGDLRFFVSYGFGAPDEIAAEQTMSAFNYVGPKLEWRVSNATGIWRPFATILRWYTQIGDGSEPDGQILVVTKLEAGNTCHVAYIDARLTPNANQIARDFADNEAENFQCGIDDIHHVPN